MIFARVNFLVMRDIVDLVLIQKRLINNPWRVRNNFIRPSTMPDCFTTLGVGHGWGRLVLRTENIRANANHEMNLGKGKFGLAKLQGMAKKE